MEGIASDIDKIELRDLIEQQIADQNDTRIIREDEVNRRITSRRREIHFQVGTSHVTDLDDLQNR